MPCFGLDFTADHLGVVLHLLGSCQDMYEKQGAKLYPEDAGIKKKKENEGNFFSGTKEIAQTSTSNVSDLNLSLNDFLLRWSNPTYV